MSEHIPRGNAQTRGCVRSKGPAAHRRPRSPHIAIPSTRTKTAEKTATPLSGNTDSLVDLLLTRHCPALVTGLFYMPTAPKRPCTFPGCGALIEHGSRCPRHKREGAKQYDRERGTAYERGYGARWQKASAAFLRAHPLCQCPECQEGKLRVLPSQVTDHIVSHRGDMRLFWDRANWQAMSKTCHDKKTAREDGGFGNRSNG